MQMKMGRLFVHKRGAGSQNRQSQNTSHSLTQLLYMSISHSENNKSSMGKTFLLTKKSSLLYLVYEAI